MDINALPTVQDLAEPYPPTGKIGANVATAYAGAFQRPDGKNLMVFTSQHLTRRTAISTGYVIGPDEIPDNVRDCVRFVGKIADDAAFTLCAYWNSNVWC